MAMEKRMEPIVEKQVRGMLYALKKWQPGMHGAAFFCFGAGRGGAGDIFFGVGRGGAGQGSKFTGRGGARVKPSRGGAFSGQGKKTVKQ